ncbi:MAG: hypothetical protein M1827_002163 [Pycnora praestabilis]|nr:MAG: hypothetical protein M1827_002163 [Pycnora praestabilis]
MSDANTTDTAVIAEDPNFIMSDTNVNSTTANLDTTSDLIDTLMTDPPINNTGLPDVQKAFKECVMDKDWVILQTPGTGVLCGVYALGLSLYEEDLTALNYKEIATTLNYFLKKAHFMDFNNPASQKFVKGHCHRADR